MCGQMVVDATGLLGKRFGPASDYTESPIQLHKPSFQCNGQSNGCKYCNGARDTNYLIKLKSQELDTSQLDSFVLGA